jgi:hypothetical protein
VEPGSASSFKKSYDIYSLGVILVELAYWSSIDVVVKIENVRKALPSVTHGIQGLLLGEDRFLDHIRAQVGNVYRDVCEKCLRGAEGFGIDAKVDETDLRVATCLQEAFVEDVVDPLEGLRI